MTTNPPNPPPEPSEENNLLTPLVNFVRRPSTLITGGVLLTLGIGVYGGINYFVYQKLSPLLSTQLSKVLEREVKVGKVESFSINSIRIGRSSIPATQTDQDYAELEEIAINFNLLPIFIGQPLTVDIAINDPNLFIDQNKTGEWIKLPEMKEGGELNLPIDIDANIRLKDVDIAVRPYGFKKSLTLEAEGKAGYNYKSNENQQVSYDLGVNLLNSDINIAGETNIKSWQTQAQLKVNQLGLSELVSLIPNSPVTLNSGEVNGDVSLSVPSLEKIEGTTGLGEFNISTIEANINSIKEPLKVNLNLDFKGKTVQLQNTEISLGKLVTKITGGINWEQGYNLNIDLNPVSLKNLVDIVPLKLPIKLGGGIQGKINLNGEIRNPILTGTINNTESLLIDKVPIKTFKTNFQANLDQFLLKQVQIIPTAGGGITAKGKVETGILKAIEKQQGIDWQKMPLAFVFEAQLPTEKLATPYYQTTQNVSLGNIAAKGAIGGTLGKPSGKIQWQAPNLVNVSGEEVSGQGEVALSGLNILLKDTVLRSTGGNITVNGVGDLKEMDWQTVLTANAFSLDPFLRVACSFTTCPDQVFSQSVNLSNANVRLSGLLDDFDLAKIDGRANLTLNIDGGAIAVNSRLAKGNINAIATASGISLDPYVPNLAIPVILGQSRFNLSGSVDKLFANSTLNINRLRVNGNTRLTVDGSPINATIDLGNGILQTVARTGQIPINKIVPNLPVDAKLISSNVTLTGNLNSLLASLGKDLDFDSFTANAEAQLAVENSPINVRGGLNNGRLNGLVNLGELSLNRVIPALPITANLTGGDINVSSQLSPLLSTTPDLSSAEATANLRLSAAQGNINTSTRLRNNQWTTNINAANLNPALIIGQIAPQVPPIDISNLNAKIDLSGSIEGILEGREIIPVQIENVAVQTDGQTLNAQGNVQLSNILTNPDIANVNLSVNANSNFDQLPLTQLISIIPLDKKFLPEELSLEGQGQLTGKLIGKNLLTAPTAPGNLRLLGDLRVRNLVFNDRVFESVLTGKINATLGENIALNLQGKQDKIAATLTPCRQQNCLFPYLPASFELRQIAGEEPPIIAQGTLQGDRLTTKIEALPLELAKIAPGTEYGIPGYISGLVNTQLEINTSTLEGRGTLTIDRPRLGFIEAKELTADIRYKDNVAFLRNASLKLGQSSYDVQGSLNLQSLALQGKLTVDDGRVEDLLTALTVTNIERVLDLIKLQPPDYATAEAIPPQSVGNPQGTIAEQVNLLAVIDEKIRQLAALRKRGGIPTELDIRGSFDTNIALGGTLLNPTVNLAFIGNNWEWHPQAAFPDIVPPLGLIMLDEQFIPINRINVQAKLANGAIAIEPAQIQLKETLLALQGNFSLQNIDADWRVEKFSVDTIRDFVQLPVDVGGFLNASGTLRGTPTQPEIQGQFAFLEGAFQGRSLEKIIQGQFSYQDDRFQLATTDASFVYAAVNLPFPITPDNDAFNIEAKLGTDALELVSVLTGEQVVLIGGEGQINAQVQGRIDLSEGLTVNDLNAQGKVLLNETVFQSAALPEPLTVSGEINLDDQAIKIPQLQGTFAQSTLAIAGVLPLFESQPQLENPLTVAIEKGTIDLEGLYRGGIEGSIFVTGNALKPIVGGAVRLADGRVFIPQAQGASTDSPNAAFTQWARTRRQVVASTAPIPFIPQLQDFRVVLQNLSVQRLPLFQFEFGGDLTVNGSLNNLTALEPEGSVVVSRGLINFLDTRFFIERRNLNQIVFYPDKGLLNPDLDLQLRTIVSEVPDTSKNFRAADTSEIPDDSLNKVQRIDINLALQGSLTQLIPSLGKDESELCLVKNPLQPIRTETTWTKAELAQLENCLTLLAEQGQGNFDEQLLSNPVINLTSSPPRSQGEIVRLLGEQIFVLAEALQGQSTEQLIQFGIVQLALPMVFQTLIYDMETAVSETIGSTDFRIVPFLETIYEVEDQGFVRLSYDYGFNEFRVRYEKRF